MPAEKTSASAQVGDLVIIASHRLGELERFAEILEVVETSTGQHYRVRWDDGHESIFFPGSDAIVRPAARHTHHTTTE